MKKINWFLFIIILFAVLMIATVVWIYAKRIEHIDNKMKTPSITFRANYSYKYNVRLGPR